MVTTAGFNTSYSYDTPGNLIQVTDAYGHQTNISYDSLSRKKQMSDPSMGTWIYNYDENGNLVNQTDANNKTIEFQYDPLNRLAVKLYPDQTTISYRYDEPASTNPVGRLTTVVDNTANNSGTTQYFYDKEGRANQVTRTRYYHNKERRSASGECWGFSKGGFWLGHGILHLAILYRACKLARREGIKKE
jgi:YD repeat-containing protein